MTEPGADLSLEQECAQLSPELLEEVLAGLDEEALPYDWGWTGRPSQILPVLPEEGGNDWNLALALGGRGSGKTLMGSEWIRAVDDSWPRLNRTPNGARLRISLLGRTAADVRDTLIQGESGLLAVYPPSLQDLVIYTPSRRRIDLPGSGIVTCFSADEPDQLRGPQSHISVADELASHKQVRGIGNLTAWENLEFGTRLGSCPQRLAMTTPRRVSSIKKILKDAKTDPRILLRRSTTAANVHLDLGWYQTLLNTYQGTEKGRQELDGEVLSTVTGALTSQDALDLRRVEKLPPGEYYRFVGLDPSTSEDYRDEAGIVVVYIQKIVPVSARHAYIVEDLSGQYTPDQWSEVTVQAALRHRATIVVETNAGGALIKSSLKQVARFHGVEMPPLRETWSSKAKAIRAEPVGVAIARGRVHMVGAEMELLEDEMTSWVPTESYSPNRLDAMVFGTVAGIFDAALTQGAPGSATIHTVSDRRADVPRQYEVPVRRTQMRIATRIR